MQSEAVHAGGLPTELNDENAYDDDDMAADEQQPQQQPVLDLKQFVDDEDGDDGYGDDDAEDEYLFEEGDTGDFDDDVPFLVHTGDAHVRLDFHVS